MNAVVISCASCPGELPVGTKPVAGLPPPDVTTAATAAMMTFRFLPPWPPPPWRACLDGAAPITGIGEVEGSDAYHGPDDLLPPESLVTHGKVPTRKLRHKRSGYVLPDRRPLHWADDARRPAVLAGRARGLRAGRAPPVLGPRRADDPGTGDRSIRPARREPAGEREPGAGAGLGGPPARPAGRGLWVLVRHSRSGHRSRRRGHRPVADGPGQRAGYTLMAEGRSNKAIAERLFVSEYTVQKHVGNIFDTLRLPPSPDDHRRVLAVVAYLNAQ